MVAVLRECGALARIVPELDHCLDRPGVPARLAARIDEAASHDYALPVRFACLALDVAPDAIAALATRVNAPTDCRDLARLASLEREEMQRKDLDAQAALSLLERCDALRRPERLERLLEVAECDAHCHKPARFVPREFLGAALAAARSVDAGAAARAHPDDVPGAVRRARLAAIAALQAPTGH